jgi:ATP-binding cassette subfamily F protein uup
MNVLVAENVSRSYGNRVLFKNITLGLSKGDKVALVAANGTGKTNLLSIIAGEEPPESGKVIVRDTFTLAYVKQEPGFSPESRVIDCLLDPARSEVQTYLKYHKAISENDTDAISNLMERMEEQGAWDLESRAKALADKLDIPEWDTPIQSLSGGQLRRVALAAALVSNPDILILDEPTNHLDVQMIEWLEEQLDQEKLTLLMVTHDRYFLDSVCTKIMALEDGILVPYEGNYTYYLEQYAARKAAQQSEVEKAKNTYRRELEWVRRMPKARGTKSKSRLDAFEILKEKAFSLKKHREIELGMRMKRMGSKIIEFIKIGKQYPDKALFQNFTYSFRKGERIGIVGPNGSGKTTLLKMIMEEILPDSGKITRGETLEIGYYRQENTHLPEDKRVIELVKDIGEVFENDRYAKASASQMLQRFNFGPDLQYTYVGKLSGGERRKLSLLLVLLKQPNFLILDEPTNDLDLMTLQALEDFLEDYSGCLLMVSHDRFFMDRLADQLFVFDGKGGLSVFGGSYSEYRAEEEIRKMEEKSNKVAESKGQRTASQNEKKDTPKPKLSFNEQRDLKLLPETIEKLEEEKKNLTLAMANPDLSHMELNQISEKLSICTGKIDELSERWIVLSEKAEGLN